MQTRNVLIAAAAVALAAGLIPFAQRSWDARKSAQALLSAQRVHATQVAEVEALSRTQLEFVSAHKAEILAGLSQQQSAGQHGAVLLEASKYRLANDPDIQNLYRISANEVSNAQLFQRFRDVLLSQCTGIQAQQTAAATMSVVLGSDARTSTSQWQYERLESELVLASIRKRLVELMHATPDGRAPAGASKGLMQARASHSLRLHPLVAGKLLDAANPAEAAALVCAWRVRGSRADATQAFDLTLWYAPSATERTLEYDVLALKLK